MPFKFIHLTDTHLARPGLKLYGLDPRARLDAAVADINAHHSDAAFAVVTGDLTHWGEVEAYANFAEAMAALKIPYIAMVGNHDRPFSTHWTRPATPARCAPSASTGSRKRSPLRPPTCRSSCSCIIRRSRSASTPWTRSR
jgi:3',5'-cyclic AMP phosphodiesterase CpdA